MGDWSDFLRTDESAESEWIEKNETLTIKALVIGDA
jgi:hypothetical protein